MSHCSACNGVLLSDGMSECPYCATKLPGADSSAEPNEFAPRLQKTMESEHFAAAMAFTPQEGPEYDGAVSQIRRGVIFGVIALALLWFGHWIVGGIVALLAIWQAVKGVQKRSELLKYPLVRRAAIVSDRRSETAFNGYSSRVFYQFTLELPNNARGEFRFPGRGWSYSPLNRGVSGVAYTRGKNLVEFKNIKS